MCVAHMIRRRRGINRNEIAGPRLRIGVKSIEREMKFTLYFGKYRRDSADISVYTGTERDRP